MAVLRHSLLHSPTKISLFVSPCPPECYLQRETKIEPDLKLLKSLFNSKFLQTLIEHCLPLLFCRQVNWKKLTRKTCRTFFEFGLPVMSHVYVYIYTRAVIKSWGPGISPGYYECCPRLLLMENKGKLEPTETPRCLIPRLLVVFTQQLEILTTTLYTIIKSSINPSPPTK